MQSDHVNPHFPQDIQNPMYPQARAKPEKVKAIINSARIADFSMSIVPIKKK